MSEEWNWVVVSGSEWWVVSGSEWWVVSYSGSERVGYKLSIWSIQYSTVQYSTVQYLADLASGSPVTKDERSLNTLAVIAYWQCVLMSPLPVPLPPLSPLPQLLLLRNQTRGAVSTFAFCEGLEELKPRKNELQDWPCVGPSPTTVQLHSTPRSMYSTELVLS